MPSVRVATVAAFGSLLVLCGLVNYGVFMKIYMHALQSPHQRVSLSSSQTTQNEFVDSISQSTDSRFSKAEYINLTNMKEKIKGSFEPTPLPNSKLNVSKRSNESKQNGHVEKVADHKELKTRLQFIGPEPLVEKSHLPTRLLSHFEKDGNNILITMRTIKTLHDSRFPVLFSTWLTKVNRSNVFITADDMNPHWLTRVRKEGMHYIRYNCTSQSKEDRMCCQMGTELGLIFENGNEHFDWVCHIDDDIYLRIPPLVKLLSHFDGKTDSIYLGRSGSAWDKPRKVLKDAKIGTEGQVYHFAVGGMLCLSRAMLELARPYLIGGQTYSKTCAQTLEPDDVTIGLVVGTVLNKSLSRTEQIYTHGLHLRSTVNPSTLDKQVAFAYGYGSIHWGRSKYNTIYVPDALYPLSEDESQFKSLHCHLYPSEPQCIERAQHRNKAPP